jgi:hypothetical protein
MKSAAAALIAVAAVAVVFAIFCLVDLVRAEEVLYLPKWLWSVICLISIPLGGVVYLVLGKAR